MLYSRKVRGDQMVESGEAFVCLLYILPVYSIPHFALKTMCKCTVKEKN